MKCIKIPVPDIDSFPVILFIQIPIQVAVIICRRIVPVMLCPCICKFPGRCMLSTDYIRNRLTAHCSKLSHEDHRIDVRNLMQKIQVKLSSYIDHYDHMLILFRTKCQIYPFYLCQTVFIFTKLTFSAFSCLSRNHVNAGIGL